MHLGGSLFRKYALFFGAVVGGALFISNLLNIGFSYQQNKQALVRLQQEKARGAAERIGQILFDLEQKISSATLPQEGVSALDQRMAEIQLLRRTPAIREITLIDPQGLEVLRVSRYAPDVLRSGRNFSTSDAFKKASTGYPYRSPVYFQDNALFMTIAMAVGPQAAGITEVEIDLEFLLGGITRIKVGDSGHAYALDADGDLIAHPDIGLVLKHSSLKHLPQVQAAINQPLSDSGVLIDAIDLEGRHVLTAFGVIPYLGWFVFVEEPLTEAYQPLYAQALRSALLMLAAIVITVLACVALVRKMVTPIHALRDGAQQIGKGVFDQQITVNTGDELEELAQEFNRMASQLRDSYSLLEHKVVERTLALTHNQHLLLEAQRIAGLGSFVFDVPAGVWHGSDVLDKLLGVGEAHSHTYKEWVALLHPEDAAPMSDYISAALRTRTTALDKIFRITRFHDHAVRWVHGLGKVEFDPQGQPLQIHGTLQDITERKEMEDQVRQLAFYDPLTALPNRRLLDDRLNQTLIAGKRSGSFGALMFLDLDNFKPLNDRYGHAVGDLLLSEVARRLNSCVRKADTVSRFGGDEFVVMLCDLSSNLAESTAHAQVVAEKIRASLGEDYRLSVQIDGNTITTIQHHCSASIGVRVFNCQDSNANDILKRADDAMYAAKQAGRNQVRFHAEHGIT